MRTGLRSVGAERTGLAAAGTATARLGSQLGAVATSADRVRTGLRSISAERAGLAAAGTVTARLGSQLTAAAASADRVRTGLRSVSAERAGLAAAGTVTARLGTQLTAVATSADRVRTGLRSVGAERTGLTATGAATARLGSDLAGLSRQAGQTAGSLGRVGSQRAAIAGTAAVAAELARNLDRAASAASRVRVSARLGGLTDARGSAGSTAQPSLGRLTAEADRAASALSRLTREAGRVRTGRPATGDDATPRRPSERRPRSAPRDGIDHEMAMAGRGAIGGVIGGGIAVDGYRRAAAFDRRLTMIGQTADATRAQIDALGASVHNLAQETATPVDKLAGGLEALVAQGRSLREALDFLPSVARTAAATGSDVDDIAKSADSVGSNFKIASKEMQAAFDIMAAGGKAGQFELKDMARYLPSLGPATSAIGFNGRKGLADLVAMLQVMRKGSGTAEEAVSSMTNILSKMESDKTLKGFKDLGVDAEKAFATARKEGKNLVEVFEELVQQALKGDRSKIGLIADDQEFKRGIQALMSFRGEWQKLSGTLQTGSDGTVMRDVVQVTKDAQAAIDRTSNAWNRFIQAASRAADAGGVSKGLGDTAEEFQSIAVALERINAAYAEGGLTGALKQAAGDAGDRIRENRKAWLDERGKREDLGIAKLEADKDALRERLQREGHSPESIESRLKLRQDVIDQARRRRAVITAARQDPGLADRKPLRMGVDPTAPIQGKPGPVGIGTVEFNKAFPIELRPQAAEPRPVPLPPQRPADVPRFRGIETIEDVLGAGSRGASPALEEAARALGETGRRSEAPAPAPRPPATTAVAPERFGPDLRGAVRSEMSAGLEAMAARLRTERQPIIRPQAEAPSAAPARSPARPAFGVSGPIGATVPAPGLGGASAFPLAADLAKAKFDPQPMLIGMQQVEAGATRLKTTLSQDLSEPARQSMASYTAAMTAGVAQATAAVETAAAKMKASLSFTATPTITPRITAPSSAPTGGGGGAAPASAPARGAGGGSSAPKLQTARLRRGGGVNVNGPVHVHGVTDVASLNRGIQREADRRARDSRDNGLHDLGAFA